MCRTFPLLILLLFGSHSLLFSQDEKGWEKLPVGDGSSHKVGSVAFFQKKAECDGQKGLLLKVVNSSDKELELSWTHAFLLDNGWKEGTDKKLEIAPKDTQKGSCAKKGETLWIPYPKEESTHALRHVRVK